VADDTGYQPSPLGGAALAAPPPNYTPTYAPSPLPGKPSIGVYQPSQLDVIAHVETGNRNIPQQIHDRNTDAGTPAGGNFQFIDPTWRRMAPKAGVDIRQYPTAMSAPPSVQAQVAAVTPINQWGPNTVAALKAHFPSIDTSKPPTGPYNGAAVGGAPQPVAVPAAQPAQQAGIGAAIAALNAPTGGPGTKSTADNLSSMAGGGGGGGGSAPPPLDLQAQQAAAAQGNARQMMLAQQGAQLAAALRGAGGARGSPGPASTMAYMGGQMIPMPVASSTPGAPQPPGTTLNSTGGLYG
jgi:hypothetical protein